MTDHPITPPPELLKQWEDDWFDEREHADVLLIQAYQAGADAELEACCKLLELSFEWDRSACEDLRAERRPPTSLKQQSLKHLETMERDGYYLPEILQDLRRALEALPDD